MKKLLALLVVVGVSASASPLAAQEAGDVFGKDAKYKTFTFEQAKVRVTAWAKKSGAAADVQKKMAELWAREIEDVTGPQLVKLVAATVALADQRAGQLIEMAEGPYDREALPEFGWLKDEKVDQFVRDNLRLLVGRWLCQEKLYDETVVMLKDIKPENIVDPASLLFYQSVAYHRLLIKKEGTESIRALLEDVADSPQRYVAVAGLMQQDLAALKDGSLDDISRRMEDVERRLDMRRAGKRVRRKEDEIVALLDKMIKDIEEKQKKQASSSSSGGSPQSSRPAQQSGILPGQGPGQVDPRNLGRASGWGDLPPKKRQEALQQLGKDFPAHYRAAIEQYFRRVAAEGAR